MQLETRDQILNWLRQRRDKIKQKAETVADEELKKFAADYFAMLTHTVEDIENNREA